MYKMLSLSENLCFTGIRYLRKKRQFLTKTSAAAQGHLALLSTCFRETPLLWVSVHTHFLSVICSLIFLFTAHQQIFGVLVFPQSLHYGEDKRPTEDLWKAQTCINDIYCKRTVQKDVINLRPKLQNHSIICCICAPIT